MLLVQLLTNNFQLNSIGSRTHSIPIDRKTETPLNLIAIHKAPSYRTSIILYMQKVNTPLWILQQWRCNIRLELVATGAYKRCTDVVI